MARPIKTRANVNVGIRIVNHFVDGQVKEIDLYKGDLVENLQYVKEEEVVTISGRITDISISTIASGVKSYKNLTDPIKDRIQVNSVTIDHSAIFNAEVSKIPAKEILEYQAEDAEVSRVEILPLLSVNLNVVLSDGSVSEATLKEGSEIADAVILSPEGDKTIDIKVASFVYTIVPKSMSLTVNGILLDKGEAEGVQKEQLPLLAIKKCGKSAVVVGEDSLQETITKLKDTDGAESITLDAERISEALVLGGDITLKGAYANIPANYGERATDTISEKETIFVESLTCEDGADVTIQGVTITEKSAVNIGNANSVTFKNCKFTAIEPTTEKTHIISGASKFYEAPATVKVVFDGCYFGSNLSGDLNKYNGLELNCLIGKGSVIKNCYFTKKAASHNLINVYGIEDGANLLIANNHFEYSANAIRIGTIGDARANITIRDNVYDETDSTAEYAGLVIFQPYGNKTVSMANLRVDINNTKKPTGQLFYGFFNKNDTQMNSSLWPKIYVDGKKQALTLGDEVATE